MSAYDYLFKFIMVGDSNVGKTCMLTRYVDGWFKADNDPTIGVEFGSKITTAEDGTVVRIQVWDTAGQESFRAITKSYYRGAIAAILVYDVTKRETFESLPTWLNETLTTGKNSIVLLMIGNKTDLAEKRQVTTKEAQEFARAHKILFMETSAKNGDNIEKAFECVKNIVLDRIRKGDINPKDELGVKEGSLLSKKLEEDTVAPGKRCC